MEKIKSFLKKNMKISIMIFMIMICSFIFNNKVSAKELSDFCSFTSPCLSTEIIEEMISSRNINTDIYDSYVIIGVQVSETRSKLLYAVYPSTDVKMYFDTTSSDTRKTFRIEKNKSYTILGNMINGYSSGISTSDLSLNVGSYVLDINNDEWENLVYYSNVDILDQDGNVILKANDKELSEIEQNIVNNRNFLEKFTIFTKQLYTIESNLVGKIVTTPLLMIPFGFCILIVVIAIFYNLFTRR